MTTFLIVNGFFVAAFVAMVIFGPPIWAWVLFVVAWCVADYVLAREVHLAWWHWALLIAGLTVIDIAVLYFAGKI